MVGVDQVASCRRPHVVSVYFSCFVRVDSWFLLTTLLHDLYTYTRSLWTHAHTRFCTLDD